MLGTSELLSGTPFFMSAEKNLRVRILMPVSPETFTPQSAAWRGAIFDGETTRLGSALLPIRKAYQGNVISRLGKTTRSWYKLHWATTNDGRTY